MQGKQLLLLRHGFDLLINNVRYLWFQLTLGFCLLLDFADCFLCSVSPLVALPSVAQCPCISHICHSQRDKESVWSAGGCCPGQAGHCPAAPSQYLTQMGYIYSKGAEYHGWTWTILQNCLPQDQMTASALHQSMSSPG